MVKNALKQEDGTLTPARNILAGMTAGLLVSICGVTPTERVKSALIDDARSSRVYASTPHATRSIIQENGLRGLYRGLTGTTIEQASAVCFHMGSYNVLKDLKVKHGVG
ncbi:hypothetical protein B2J93_6626 [Marssonina coronariae]|uniref:Tricarboxylate transport protein n=1 Tax=Diplocarpon coronariae TaxID=2795749 RepID=A0A218YV77_9HELO|nr:hypothetical protein B2J93_6626 [Marssonina coronariae]